MTDKKLEHENISKMLRAIYGLNDIQINNVLEYAYELSQTRNKSNDIAIAYCLNNLAINLFEMVVDNNNLPDTNDINRSYVLITSELKLLYARNSELEDIKDNICWQSFGRLEHIEDEVWDWKQYNQNDYGVSHNAQVNTLCILNGNETPEFSPKLKKIVEEANAASKSFHANLEETSSKELDWFIPEYTLTYKIDGSIIINDVLVVKKTQSGLASDKLMTQAIKNQGEQFKPDLGKNYSRNLTTTLNGIGFKKNESLQQLFFPTASNSEGILFRSSVTRHEATNEHINTRKLDAKLKELGATIVEKPFDINDIPF